MCDKGFSPPLSTRVNLEEYSHKLFEKSITFEAWSNKTLIGMIAAYFNDFKNSNGFITNVCVVESFKGMHIASKLMKLCIDFANEHRFKRIYLEVNENNISAINLYTKFSFKPLDKKDNYVEMMLEINN